MRRSFTLFCTAIGAALCLVHFLFHDYDFVYLAFYAFSVPAWFAPIVSNVYEISMAKMMVIYILTIASWALIGYVIDRFAAANRRRSRS